MCSNLLLLYKFFNNVKEELETQNFRKNPFLSQNVSTVANLISELIDTDKVETDKKLKKLISHKQPIQHIYEYYVSHSSKGECVKLATENVQKTYSVLKPYCCPCYCDLDEKYYFYLDGNPPLADKGFCYGCLVNRETDKVIYEFECPYEEYKTDRYIQELAFAIFILSNKKEIENL